MGTLCVPRVPASNGDVLRIRKGGTPEAEHKEIYKTLGITMEVIKPVKTWKRFGKEDIVTDKETNPAKSLEAK